MNNFKFKHKDEEFILSEDNLSYIEAEEMQDFTTEKVLEILEDHFYIFTKEGKYIISNISNEFETTTYSQLERMKKIDESYIVSIIICESCKNFAIEVEQCDM